jgi:hypothetical protein
MVVVDALHGVNICPEYGLDPPFGRWHSPRVTWIRQQMEILCRIKIWACY